ncbi:mercury methylation ferredoxin HgcB [Pseudodesulfovibrio sp. zrk46]|uniref:mercury methylation ferredoxin HgcB n=1 Tax=Pseudodesulfovibrio sp. zrk46 TaxID=2725288 RepID=UPI0014493CB7|nr:mercury methylation ferredoxin HgcB [Pseudodesulfovibrio sp. zrk46]QJB55000.1 4Fe-4S binding protein [Pseudodesulfovibrio sp. zrk46]
MKDYRYLPDVATLTLNHDACVGCGLCVTVCPHRALIMKEGKAHIADLNGCIECGACMRNCPTEAVNVNPGTGCATLIMDNWLYEMSGGRLRKKCC